MSIFFRSKKQKFMNAAGWCRSENQRGVVLKENLLDKKCGICFCCVVRRQTRQWSRSDHILLLNVLDLQCTLLSTSLSFTSSEPWGTQIVRNELNWRISQSINRYFIFNYEYLCFSIWVCVPYCRYPLRPVASDPIGLQLYADVSHLVSSGNQTQALYTFLTAGTFLQSQPMKKKSETFSLFYKN